MVVPSGLFFVRVGMQEKNHISLYHRSSSLFIVLSGNIGSGKTTMTRKLAETLKLTPFFEAVHDNPYLEDFYKDMLQWSFPLQIFFLNHRFRTHKMIQEQSQRAIQDRSIYEDAHIFARALYDQGDMSKRDYENYLCLYQSMQEFLKPPTLMIYLRKSVPLLKNRIHMRNRDFEKGLSVDYLYRLNEYYEQWYHQYNHGPKLCVDTDDQDYLLNESHFQNLCQMISSQLKT
jgi:deoxyadenosine/deoxycytidine kinase